MTSRKNVAIFWWSLNCLDQVSQYSGTEYSYHLNTGQYGCPVFKWLSHMTWQSIRKLNILDHKQAFFSPDFRPPFEYQII